MKRIFSPLLLFSLFFIFSGVLGDHGDCSWKYKCEKVLLRRPYICGRWSREPEKICPEKEVEELNSPPAPSDNEDNAAAERCQTTYQCCKLAIPRRHLHRHPPPPPPPGPESPSGARPLLARWRFRSRLIKHWLRENNQNWRRGSACLKWCPVMRQDCATNELPQPFEPPPPPQTRTGEIDETATGDEDGAAPLETGLSGVSEVNVNEEEEALLEAPNQTADQENGQQEGEGEEVVEGNANVNDDEVAKEEGEGSEIIEVPPEQKLSIGSRRIIQVPCNGNARPDRTGVCRSVW